MGYQFGTVWNEHGKCIASTLCHKRCCVSHTREPALKVGDTYWTPEKKVIKSIFMVRNWAIKQDLVQDDYHFTRKATNPFLGHNLGDWQSVDLIKGIRKSYNP